MSNMKAITEVIRTRRTCKPKLLSNRPIERSLIDEILENANWAPTHGMTEPWRFTVFTGDACQRLADFLADTYKTVTSPEAFKQNKYESLRINPTLAPVVIAIGMSRQASGKISELDELQAVACAVQNMHLTATAHGLGGFWSTNPVTTSNEMRDYLGMESKDRALGLFYLGYPAGDWPSGTRTPIEDKVTWRTDS